jgi:D-alanyl-D-alanine carboxypeptidase
MMAKQSQDQLTAPSAPASGADVDALIKIAVLRSLEAKPPEKNGDNWLGVPKAVFLSGLGTLLLALFNWFLSIQTEKAKLSNELIKLAVSVEDQEQAARNLRFLSRLELISVREDQLNTVLEDPKSRPLFTSPGGLSYRIGDDGAVEFEGDWVEKNIISTAIPQLAGVKTLSSDQPFSGTVRLSREATPAAVAAFAEIEAAGLKDRILSFDGSFVPRTIRGAASRLSVHALGTAFDLNCQWNFFGKPAVDAGQKGSVKELVPIFEKHGFKWGGTAGGPDTCHFEFKPPQAEQTAAP